MQNLEYYLGANSILAYPLAFAGGLLMSFTPCVYPLIPVIAGYMAAKGERSKIKIFVMCLLYVLGMALVYSILGAVAALTGRIFGEIQRSPWAHFIIGNIIILFGLSLLDVFTLPVPGFIKKSRSGNVKKGYLGAFGLGFASGFVAAPCTSAVLGALLTYVATRQNVLFGTTLLFCFAIGVGSLLLISGLVGGFLGALPKSGPWLVRIQKIFGYLMLALGEYFIIKGGILLV
ncbi:MAG: cytochrome c biogenesis protein CcdA [Candidatus Omnitrophota bacterium]